MVDKVQVNSEHFDRWFSDPITQLLVKSLSNQLQEENTNFIRKSKLNQEPYQLERNVYRLQGKTELTDRIVSKELLKDILLAEVIEWI